MRILLLGFTLFLAISGLVQEARPQPHSESWYATQLHFSDDGKRLLARLIGTPHGPGGVIGWEIKSGQLLFQHDLKEEQRHPFVPELLFSPDGKLYCRTYPLGSQESEAAAGELKNSVIQTETGAILCEPESEPGQGVFPLVFSADGKLLAGVLAPTINKRRYGNPEITFWNTSTGKRVQLFKSDGNKERLGGVLFSADNRLMLTTVLRLSSPQKADWWVVVRDRHSGKERKRFAFSGPFEERHQLSPNGRYLALPPHQFIIPARTQFLPVWDTRSGKLLYQVPMLPGGVTYRELRFSGDSKQLLAFGHSMGHRTSYQKRTWISATGQEKGIVNLPIGTRFDSITRHPFLSVYSTTGEIVARSTPKNTIRLQNAETGEVLQEMKVSREGE